MFFCLCLLCVCACVCVCVHVMRRERENVLAFDLLVCIRLCMHACVCAAHRAPCPGLRVTDRVHANWSCMPQSPRLHPCPATASPLVSHLSVSLCRPPPSHLPQSFQLLFSLVHVKLLCFFSFFFPARRLFPFSLSFDALSSLNLFNSRSSTCPPLICLTNLSVRPSDAPTPHFVTAFLFFSL